MTRIGIVGEQAGETRVSATPVTIEKLAGLGYEVVVERGAGAASAFPDADFERAGAAIVDREDGMASGCRAQGRCADSCRGRASRRRCDAHRPAEPGSPPRRARQPGDPRHHGARARRGAAHLARPVDGRAELDGEHLGLPRRHRGGARVRPLLHRPGHGCRQGASRQGARRRRGRRGTRRDRRRVEPRRDRARDRPASRGRRPGALDRRPVPARRGRRADAVDRRLREGDQRGLRPRCGGALLRAGPRCRHRHHDGAHPRPPGPEALHGGGCRGHARRQRHRRHGRRPGRQRRGVRGGRAGRDGQRRRDPRVHRPRGAPPDAGVPAVRHEPAEPRQAPDPRQGRRARPGLRRRGPALDHRRARRRVDLAAAAGRGVGRTRRRAGRGIRPRRCRRRRRACRRALAAG